MRDSVKYEFISLYPRLQVNSRGTLLVVTGHGNKYVVKDIRSFDDNDALDLTL